MSSAAPAAASSDVGEYLRHLRDERDVSPNTLVAYERDLSELVTFFSAYYGGGAWHRWRQEAQESLTPYAFG